MTTHEPAFGSETRRVAIVTGAGRGLGRAHALELARRGVAVVVNDRGVSLDGEADSSPAQEVVDEIVGIGGQAVADSTDIGDHDAVGALLDETVANLGRVDIIVNNAGILRDRTLFNLTESDWDEVIRVHLKGHFNTIRWAASYWRDLAKRSDGPVFGRIVNTASEAFLAPVVGQPNYGAAKAGIVNLTVTAAKTLHKYGVTVNAICPRARTRMTDVREEFQTSGADVDVFAPEQVSALVAYLASADAQAITGQVFAVQGRAIHLLRPPSVEATWSSDAHWSTESVQTAIGDFFDNRSPLQNFGTSVVER